MDAANLPITSPCPIDLDTIGFDHAAKRADCSHCEKKVHNLSSMTKRQAEEVLASAGGQDICVTYKYGEDGAVRFKSPEPAVVPVSALRRRRAVAAVPVLGLVAALAACTPTQGKDSPPQPEIESVELHAAGGIGEYPNPPPPLEPAEPTKPAAPAEPEVPCAGPEDDAPDAPDVAPPDAPEAETLHHAKGGVSASDIRGFGTTRVPSKKPAKKPAMDALKSPA